MENLLVISLLVILTSLIILYFQHQYKAYMQMSDKQIKDLNQEIKRLNINIDNLQEVLKAHHPTWFNQN